MVTGEWSTVRFTSGGVSPTADDLVTEMDTNGVDRAVLVPPSFTGDDNQAAIEAVAAHPERFAIMGRVPLTGQPRPDLTAWRSVPGMLGVRLTFHRGEALSWLTDGTADWFWAAAADAELPVMVHAPGNVSQLVPVAQQYRDLRLIVDHAGLPSHVPAIPAEKLIDQVAELSRFPQIAVKASAFLCATFEPFPFPTAQRWTRRLVDAFGAERVFWGTDLTRLPCSYGDAVSYLGEPGGLHGTDLDLVMGEALLAWLGWDT